MFRILTFITGLLLLLDCSNDTIAGGSSGVDNPGITMSLLDSSGELLPIQGTVSLYRQDHNPILDPYPIFSDSIMGKAEALIEISSMPVGLTDTLKFNLLIESQSNVTYLNKKFSYWDSSFFSDGLPVSRKDTLDINLLPAEADVRFLSPDYLSGEYIDSNDMKVYDSIAADCIDTTGTQCIGMPAVQTSASIAYIEGTPYISDAQAGFSFTDLPAGIHEVVFADSTGAEIFRYTLEVSP